MNRYAAVRPEVPCLPDRVKAVLLQEFSYENAWTHDVDKTAAADAAGVGGDDGRSGGVLPHLQAGAKHPGGSDGFRSNWRSTGSGCERE